MKGVGKKENWIIYHIAKLSDRTDRFKQKYVFQAMWFVSINSLKFNALDTLYNQSRWKKNQRKRSISNKIKPNEISITDYVGKSEKPHKQKLLDYYDPI